MEKRIHSSLSYLAPSEFEEKWRKAQQPSKGDTDKSRLSII